MSQPVPLPPYPPTAVPCYPGQKPGLVTAIAVMTLVDGILNVFWAGLWLLFLLTTILSFIVTIVGILLVPILLVLVLLAAYPLVLGILEIVYGARLLGSSPPSRPARYIAIMEICEIVLLDPVALAVGILALVFYGDPRVQAYFAELSRRPQA